MTNKPFIDRDALEKTMLAAKIARAKFLTRKSREVSGAVRWGGLSVLVASALAFFSAHGYRHDAEQDGKNANHSKITRYY